MYRLLAGSLEYFLELVNMVLAVEGLMSFCCSKVQFSLVYTVNQKISTVSCLPVISGTCYNQAAYERHTMQVCCYLKKWLVGAKCQLVFWSHMRECTTSTYRKHTGLFIEWVPRWDRHWTGHTAEHHNRGGHLYHHPNATRKDTQHVATTRNQ